MADSLPVLRGERLVLRPLTDADVEPMIAILSDPSVQRWWGTVDEEAVRTDGAAFVIEVDGETVGWLAVTEEDDPDYRHAGLDLSLAPSHQDRGLGPEALRTAIDWLVSRGHHRFTIDPAAHNERAIAAYAKVGFRPVGIMRNYERGPDGTWHDSLLMDLLAEEL